MVITGIEQQVKNKKRYSVFIDGEFSFGITDIDLLYYKLKVGDELSQSKFDSIRKNVVLVNTKTKAVRLLGFKSRTVSELRGRLKQYDFPDDAIEETLNMLCNYGYLDDEKYAKDYIADKLENKGQGRNRIKSDLIRKGVDKSIIEQYLYQNDFCEIEKAYDIFCRRAKNNTNMDFKEKNRLSNFLARRGYNYDIIKEVFLRYENNYRE